MEAGRRRSRAMWRPSRRTGAVRSAATAALALLAGGCASGGPQDILTPRGPIAREEDALWDLVFPIAVAVFVLVQVLILVAVFKFRAKPDDTAPPRQVHGNTRLEILWTIVPAMILAVIAVPTVRTIFSVAEDPGPDALQVAVVGKQYFWEFQYTGDEGQGVVTATELHIPTGRPVRLTMTSVGVQNDPLGVIHSFWVPSLAGKQDVVPGHERFLTIEAEEPGRYSGQCAEFCGLSHARMRFSVVAHDPADFDAWLSTQAEAAEEPADDLAQQGFEQFTQATCIACHAIKGYEGAEARVGPDLTHFMSRESFAGGLLENNEENIKSWLRNPQAEKAGAQMPNLNLSEEQIDALTAYLQTLE